MSRRDRRARTRALRRSSGAAALTASVVAGVLGLGAASPAAAAEPSLGFDTCEAPTLDDLRAWKGASPYTSVAVYIGGEMRACRNAALDGPDWIRGALAEGWGVIPVYVGPQASCTTYHVRMDEVDARGHGHAIGGDAAARATAAGLRSGDPIYLDVEPWNDGGIFCAGNVALFIDGWVQAVHGAGFTAGLYSTAATGVRVHRAMESDPAMHPADLVWVASWNDQPGVLGDGIPADAWPGRRMHQYNGDHVETWGGVSIEIDSNWVDAPVARGA